VKNEIIVYQSEEYSTRIEVRIEEESIWLTQGQIIELFNSSKANISEHIKNILESGELQQDATVRKFRTVRIEGNRTINRNITHYSLDMIISIGYRVNSKRGTQFRIWANQNLKEYLLRGYAVNQRIERVENKVHNLQKRLDKFDLEIKSTLPPQEGIFYEGQVFDAYVFISRLIKSARSSIVLIDNYIDESVLILLAKRDNNVSASIYTSQINHQLSLDLKKFKKQYPTIEINRYSKSHDRFILIDHSTVYHIGASLKDLGKKWFAFSRIGLDAQEMINKLNLSSQSTTHPNMP